jgi:ubiquinone biosynthesis protein UbiJ
MKAAILAFFQKALQRILSLDPESSKRLQVLEGHTIGVNLKKMDVTFYCEFANSAMHLKSDCAEKPDVFIQGTPLTFMRMALTEGNRKQFFAEDVEIEGDLLLAEQMIQLFDQLEIDWEEYASGVLGDVSAHQLGRILGGLHALVRQTKTNLTRQLNEYVHEEIPLFPPLEAVADFFHDVDEIRMDVDRLAARVEHLQKNRQERA